ncbi:hypothetical protein [Pseudosulfitobacter sp. SM2401]|jgi:uncharacterized membrane protein YeaQ/YmgE (transglycosylase-associated protein family)|uniref:hypothetical protein n=1 Tax=Pseudosulfitobacter sp. SM2401 TaxID=3350098 RepID=UPI002A2D5109|nr:hypothetical protein [Ascidiaceihabitans sp.]
MFPTMIGTVVIAGIVGYLAERSNFTHNGILQSIIICVGGAFLFYFVRLMFGIGFGSAGLNAIASSVGALIIVPTHWRK